MINSAVLSNANTVLVKKGDKVIIPNSTKWVRICSNSNVAEFPNARVMVLIDGQLYTVEQGEKIIPCRKSFEIVEVSKFNSGVTGIIPMHDSGAGVAIGDSDPFVTTKVIHSDDINIPLGGKAYHINCPHSPIPALSLKQGGYIFADAVTNGVYEFSYDFDLTEYVHYTARLAGYALGDNVLKMFLNGVLKYETFYPYGEVNFDIQDGFKAGINNLTFEVTNVAGGADNFSYCGWRFDIKTAKKYFELSPDIYVSFHSTHPAPQIHLNKS